MTVVVTHTTPADSSFSSTGAAAWNADHALSGVGTMAEQDANNVAITGGTINGATVGATTPAAGTFTTLTANSTAQFGRSSANYVQAVGASASSGPVVSSQGSDTNIDLNVTSKGSGSFKINNAGGIVAEFNDGGAASPTNAFLFAAGAGGIRALIRATGGPITLLSTGSNPVNFSTNGSSGNIQAAVSHTASAVNYVQVTGAATAAQPVISTQGSDSNINLVLNAKGSASVLLQTAGQNVFQATGSGTVVNRLLATGTATTFGPSLSCVGSDTNIPLVLQPKGTGALQAQQTDSTATGGNARGANAVDWQTSRSAAAQVSSGAQAVIAGGASNTASNQYASVAGGGSHNASGFAATIGGGFQNTASGTVATIAGGNVNTTAGFFNFVGGGFTNSGTSGSAVTTQSATMNGTTAVTLSGSNANIKVGQVITGTSIAAFPHTYVAAVSGTSLTLSQAASGSSTSTLSFFTPHGVVVGGGNNQATGSYSFIGGGGDAGTAANRNVASGDWSSVLGGFKNVASGLYSTVVGGYGNTSNNTAAFVGGGGFAFGSVLVNTAQGQSSGVVSGIQNNAAGNASFIGAGYSNVMNGQYSASMGGSFGNARSIAGNHVFAANINPIAQASGITQAALLVLAVQTTDATATVLRADSNAAGTTNQVILPNNSAYYFRGTVVAGVTGGGNTKGWTIEGVIKRGANAASTTVVGVTVASMYADAGAVTWTIAAAADTTNGGLAITFTGQAATTIRCVAKIETTEMTY